MKIEKGTIMCRTRFYNLMSWTVLGIVLCHGGCVARVGVTQKITISLTEILTNEPAVGALVAWEYLGSDSSTPFVSLTENSDPFSYDHTYTTETGLASITLNLYFLCPPVSSCDLVFQSVDQIVLSNQSITEGATLRVFVQQAGTQEVIFITLAENAQASGTSFAVKVIGISAPERIG